MRARLVVTTSDLGKLQGSAYDGARRLKAEHEIAMKGLFDAMEQDLDRTKAQAIADGGDSELARDVCAELSQMMAHDLKVLVGIKARTWVRSFATILNEHSLSTKLQCPFEYDELTASNTYLSAKKSASEQPVSLSPSKMGLLLKDLAEQVISDELAGNASTNAKRILCLWTCLVCHLRPKGLTNLLSERQEFSVCTPQQYSSFSTKFKAATGTLPSSWTSMTAKFHMIWVRCQDKLQSAEFVACVLRRPKMDCTEQVCALLTKGISADTRQTLEVYASRLELELSGETFTSVKQLLAARLLDGAPLPASNKNRSLCRALGVSYTMAALFHAKTMSTPLSLEKLSKAASVICDHKDHRIGWYYIWWRDLNGVYHIAWFPI